MLEWDQSIFVVKSRKGYEKRRALIQAAFDLLAKNDLPSLTIVQLCETVGLKRNSFYTHFADLDALLDALSRLLIGQIEQQIDGAFPLDPEDFTITRHRLRRIVEIGFEAPQTARVLHQLYLFHKPTFDAIQARITNDVRFWIENGQINISLQAAETLARMLISIFMDVLRQIGNGNGDDIEIELVFELLALIRSSNPTD